MNKFLILLLTTVLLCEHSTILGQNWNISNAVIGSNIEPRYSVIDNNDNIYILATFQDTIYAPFNIFTNGMRDLSLLKISPTGEILWITSIGSSGAEVAGGLTMDGLNNLYVAGTFFNTCNFGGNPLLTSSGAGDIFLAKYDQDGQLKWAKTIGQSDNTQSSSDIKFRSPDRIGICGYFNDSIIVGSNTINQDTLIGSSFTSIFISELDTSGNPIWSKRFLNSSNSNRFLRANISQNGYYFGGYFQGNMILDVGTISSYVSNTYDAFVYKTDLNGNGEWVRRIRGLNTENFRTLTTDEFDNVYVLGNYNSAEIFIDSTETITKSYTGNLGGYDTFIGKYNRSGMLQWFLRKGSTARDIYNDFVVRNNVIYATGFFTDQIIFNNDTLRTSSITNSDAFVAAFNQIGDPISGVSIIGTGNFEDAGSIVNMDASSRAYVSGYYRSPQIQIGDEIYTSNNINKSDLFFAIYQQPFKAVITDEQQVSCFGLSDGMLQVTPYFGRPPFTYSWSHNPGLNNPVANNLPIGEYTVTITDANDSIASIVANVTQPGILAVNGLLSPVTCNNGNDGAIDITVTGGTPGPGFNYFWTSLDGSGVQPLIPDQTNLSAGTYTVEVEDANGCAATVDFAVLEPAPLSYEGTVVIPITNPPGGNGSINLLPSGGNAPYSFVWNGPGGFTSLIEDIGPLSNAGLYNLSLTDAKSCTSDTSFLVDDEVTLIAQVVAKTDILCFGGNNGSATVRVTNGNPPYSYNWGPLGTIIDSTQVGMIAGDYIVTVTDSDSKVTSASVSILGPSAALSLVLDPEDLTCSNNNSGVIDLNVSGGTLPYFYAWDNGYTGEDLVNVAAGTYTVVVTDENNCVQQSTREVTQPQAITLGIASSGTILCYGDNTAIATAIAGGGTPPGTFTYQWDDPGAQTTQSAFDLGAGTYHVTVTDSNGCFRTEDITILEPEPLLVNATLNSPTCPGDGDGSIIPTPSGGTGTGYEYIWSNNVFTRFNLDLPGGTYILTMNDANNCTIVDTFELAEPDPLEIYQIDITPESCDGKQDGAIAMFGRGGTGLLEYSIDDGGSFTTDPTADNLTAGTYNLILRDENDCLSETAISLIELADSVLIDTIIAVDASCLGLDDGSLEITALGGTGVYEYSVDGGTSYSATSTLTSLPAGIYPVAVRDDNNCNSEEIPVTLIYSDTVRIVTLDAVDLSCSGQPDGSISITAAGGTSPYEYSSDGGSTFGSQASLTSLAQGDYTVVVRDDNACLSTDNEVTLSINTVCGLIIYDAFSPNNGDTQNDVWTIGNAGSFPTMKVNIYNIWGKAVFSSTGYEIPWDGTLNGNDLPSGTYYYVIDPGDGSAIISGDVSIVK